MTNRAASRTAFPTARLAGVLYLIIIVCGVWSEAGVRAGLIVAGDAAATVANVIAAEGLFRLSMSADAVMALSDVALAILLYRLLRAFGEGLALAATAFRLVQAAIIGAGLALLAGALVALGGDGFAAADQGQGVAYTLIAMHGIGYDIGLLFFGVNSLLVGMLLARVGGIARLIGFALLAAGAVYLAGSFIRLLAPELTASFMPAYAICLLAESTFCLLLLVRGDRPFAASRASH
ncbi:MAG: DUF4386 domain-containing protein [Hyphomicrobiales bacterium]|nr:MAG: DUF4386 domain-containing protein [Hyphomicrobiales bacterium]